MNSQTSSALLSTTKYPARSSVFFRPHHDLYSIADSRPSSESVDKITEVINLRTNGYAARRDHFTRIGMRRFSTKSNSCVGIFLSLAIFAGNTHAKDCEAASIEPKCEFSPSLTINFPFPRSTIHFFLADQAGPAETSVLIKTPGGKKLLLDSIGAEGGEIPKIESTFLADANKDGKNDLLILASWNINHPGLKTTGNYFRTFVYGYDDIRGGLYRIECAEEIIGSGIVGTVEGEKENYPYTNAGRIRKLLQHSQCSLKSTADSQD